MRNSPQRLPKRSRSRFQAIRRNHSRDRSLRFENLENRQLLAASAVVPLTTSVKFSDGSVTALTPMTVSQTTGQKPQSKLWTYDDQWFCVMPDSSGTWIWRLDGTNWTHILQISTLTKSRADVLTQGDLVQILLVNASNPANSQLASVQYVPGSLGSYEFWSIRPTLTNVSLANNDETATLAVDSTGEMWIASDVSSTIEVRYSIYPYVSFSAPITIGSGISSDDISVITAMPSGEVGVLWSNQSAKRFYFRSHQDGADPTAWSTAEAAAGQSALSVGAGMADDHLNAAVASDGTLYFAAKTSYDTGGKVKIGLLVRRPSGTWDPIYTVDTSGTRPLVLLDEEIGRLMVVYTTSEGGGDTVYRETPLDKISFSPRVTLMKGNNDNVTSTKQNVTDQILIMNGNGQDSASKAYSVLLTLALPSSDPQTKTPVLAVNAGADQTIQLPAGPTLHGIVTENSLPPPAGTVTTWTATGPGTVSFADPSLLDTTATFGAPGTYVVRLTAADGSQTAYDELTIIVNAVASNPNPDPPPSPQITDGLVGYWKLDETSGTSAADNSGQSNHGTLVGGPTPATGIVDGAFQFNGSNRVVIPDQPSLDISNQITISAWINPQKVGTQYLVKKARSDKTDGFELSLSDKGKVFVRFNQKTSNNKLRIESKTSYPSKGNTWMFVAATYDGSTIKLYINGVLEATRSATFKINVNSLPLGIGAQDDGKNGMKGRMDDVRIYNRALSAAEIAALAGR